MDEHLFLKKEGEYAQKQWESWAERYLVITASCVYLPDKITVSTLCDELPLQYGLVKKIDYLSDSGHKVEACLRVLLREITDKFCQLPAALPVNVGRRAVGILDGAGAVTAAAVSAVHILL